MIGASVCLLANGVPRLNTAAASYANLQRLSTEGSISCLEYRSCMGAVIL